MNETVHNLYISEILCTIFMVLHLIFILSLFMCPASCNHMMVSNLQSIFTCMAVGRPVATEILPVWQPSWSGSPTEYRLLQIWFPDSLHLLSTNNTYCDSHSCLYIHHKWLDSHICANMFDLIWWTNDDKKPFCVNYVFNTPAFDNSTLLNQNFQFLCLYTGPLFYLITIVCHFLLCKWPVGWVD